MTAYYHDPGKKNTERKRVVVTGIGAVTPLGNTLDDSWNNLVKGTSGIGPITSFDATHYPVKIGGEVKGFDFEDCVPEDIQPFLGRGSQFCIQATREALSCAGLDLERMDTANVGISLGSNEEYMRLSHFSSMFETKSILELLELRKDTSHGQNPYPHLMNAGRLGRIWPLRRSASMTANLLSILFNVHGPVSTSSSACASSAQAIGRAIRMIQDSDAEMVITGGSDSILSEFSLTGFYRLGALSKNNDNPEKSSRPFDLKRDGFILGEGAGVLLIEELSHARKRGARILGELCGYGSSSNAYSITAPPQDGNGTDACMKAALRDAECATGEVDYINAHGTSTYLNDKCETSAIKNVFHDLAYDIPVSSNKSMLGHLVASAASLEVIFSLLTIKNNTIPPTINYENPDPECDLDYVPNETRPKQVTSILSNSFAFGGQNASILIKKFQ